MLNCVETMKLLTRYQRAIKEMRQVLSGTFFVVLLGLFVWLSNIITVSASQEHRFIWINPDYAETILKDIYPYTPLIEEQNSEIVRLVKGEEDAFLTKPELQEEVTGKYMYTIQKGDTISSIAQRFNLTVASIQEANGLKALDMDRIKPGQTLTIPPYNTDDSLAWLDEINEEKKRIAEKQAAERARLARLRRAVVYRDQSSGREKITGGYSGAANSGFIRPIRGNGISRGITRYHTGIDIRANVGTPVVAAQKGRVIEVTNGWGRGWGKSVVISHGGGLTTRYAHLSKISVGVGTTVSQGQIIGYSGNSGWSTGPHLHYEGRKNGRIVNPLRL
jgi:murein DD-endopeptidase MepM/ murein hydrolase activator NlpD